MVGPYQNPSGLNLDLPGWTLDPLVLTPDLSSTTTGSNVSSSLDLGDFPLGLPGPTHVTPPVLQVRYAVRGGPGGTAHAHEQRRGDAVRLLPLHPGAQEDHVLQDAVAGACVCVRERDMPAERETERKRERENVKFVCVCVCVCV